MDVRLCKHETLLSHSQDERLR